MAVQIAAGVIIYGVMLLIMKDKMLLELIGMGTKILNRFHTRHN